MGNYLYNSVELPALPDYNGTTYPFAVIIRFLSSGGYGLACSNLPFWVVNVDGTDALALSVESDVIFFNCSAGDDSWQTSGSAFDPDPDALWIYMKPSAVRYVWTNADICRESTTDVIYAASDPVLIVTPEKPVVSAAWLRSFQTGLALGLAGEPLPIKKEPVAYLYNGVRLPKLPEWDREKYPYAYIAYVMRNTAYESVSMVVSPVEFLTNTPSSNEAGLVVSPNGEDVNFMRSYINSDSSGWKEFEAHTLNGGGGNLEATYNIIWISYDLVSRETGEIVVNKSADPVPIYE